MKRNTLGVNDCFIQVGEEVVIVSEHHWHLGGCKKVVDIFKKDSKGRMVFAREVSTTRIAWGYDDTQAQQLLDLNLL